MTLDKTESDARAATDRIDFQELRALGMPEDEREHKRVLRALWEAVEAAHEFLDGQGRDWTSEGELALALDRFDFGSPL